MSESLLPVHGFVLAGGKSSRMGRDKALLEFCGKPLIKIAVEKLRGFCADVSIAGNREDLSQYAPVVCEKRVDAGPAAGIEAGLGAAKQAWALFLPVDVPLVPEPLLRNWVAAAFGLRREGLGVSYLLAEGRHPALCLVRTDGLERISASLEKGTRRLADVLGAVDDQVGDSWLWVPEAAQFAGVGAGSSRDLKYWFSNVNTPEELAEVELWAKNK